jgi:hypothetical protein
MNTETLCKKCSQPLAAGASVHLWDGGDYCRPCVDKACPNLADYAIAHNVLEETIPYDRKAASRQLLRVYVVIWAVFCTLGAVAGLVMGDITTAIVLPLFFVLCAALAGAIQIPALLWIAKGAAQRVSVRDGNVTVCRPNRRRLAPWTFPLNNCRWYLGRLRHDTFLRGTLPRNAPTIILVYPVHWRRFQLCRYKTACGFSEEMRQLWQAFLRLTGVAEGRKPAKPTQP